MKKSASFLASALVSVALAPAALADGLNPGSALVFPMHQSDTFNTSYITVVCVTNTNLTPATPANGLGGSTALHYEYVNVVPDQGPNANPHKPLHCNVVDRIELLTPADTLCVLTSCHNAVSPSAEGYLVVSAQDPNQFNTPWSFNHLIGSEVVVNGGSVYTINAIPFKAIAEEGAETDADLDGQLDFDEVEYEGIADELYLDTFVGDLSGLTLINMTGGLKHVANVAFDVWNDNEFPISATLAFKCWTSGYLTDISLVFSQQFLELNTPNNAAELDINCDNDDDFETGWARLRGLNASSQVESIADPAILGALIEGPYGMGGRRLWESEAKQLNGDFFKTGEDDPEE